MHTHTHTHTKQVVDVIHGADPSAGNMLKD